MYSVDSSDQSNRVSTSANEQKLASLADLRPDQFSIERHTLIIELLHFGIAYARKRQRGDHFAASKLRGERSDGRGFKARKRGCTTANARTCHKRDGSKLQFMFNCPGSSLTRSCYGLYKRDVYLRSADSN